MHLYVTHRSDLEPNLVASTSVEDEGIEVCAMWGGILYFFVLRYSYGVV
jgi:hypothetical protein